MNFLKRSYLSIIRRPFKSLLLFMVVFILGNVLVGSYIIKETTLNLETSVKRRIGALATIKSPIQSPQDKKYPGIPDIINDTFDELSDILEKSRNIEGVIDVDYRTWTSLNQFETFNLKEHSSLCNKIIGENVCHSTQYLGVSSPEFNEVRNNLFNLTEGRMLTEEEIKQGAPVALISDNNEIVHLDGSPIEIGDEIPYKIRAYDHINPIKEDEVAKIYSEDTVNIKVVGKYIIKKSIDSTSYISSTFDYDRLLILPSNFIVKVRDNLYSMYDKTGDFDASKYNSGAVSMDNVRIYIDSVDYIEKVKLEVQKLIDDTKSKYGDFEVITSSDEFNKIIGPIANINSLGRTLFGASILVTIVILSLMITLFLRDRKHELGIYVSLGEKTYKILLQIIVEVVLVSFIAISISVYTGKILATSVSNQMIELQQTSDDIVGGDLSNLNQEKVIDEYTINITVENMIAIYGISMTSVLVSTVLPVVYILRIKPKKILM